MKKPILLFLIASLLFSACNKSKDSCNSNPPTIVASAAETAYLQNYLTANSITASAKNGMFYTITNPGSGTSPNLCSSISVTYTGTIITGTTDGSQFDASGTTPVTFTLNRLIPGWQLILPLVKSGGSVTLFIPPSLGYGADSQPNLPANSYLKFTMNLVSVNS